RAVNAEQAGDVRLAFACGQPTPGLLLLMRRELCRTPELDPARHGTLGPVPRPGTDQLALELRQPAEHRQHKPPMRRGGVGPSVAETSETRATLGYFVQDIEQVAGRACQA